MIKKLIDYRVELKDQLIIYSPNKIESLLKILKNRFEGICYAGAFIKKITKIINDPQYIFSRNIFDGRVYCDVRFEAECITPTSGMLMVAQFVKYIDQQVKLKTDYCEILITKNRLITNFTEKCFVPVVITNAMCNIGNKISAVGRMYFGGNSDIIFKTRGIKEPADDIKKTIDSLVDKIKKAKKRIDNATGKKLLDLFHPFKKHSVLANPINILDYKFSPGVKFIKRTPKCMANECLLFKVDKVTESDKLINYNLKTEDLVLLEVLQDTLNYLMMIDYYCDKYKTNWDDNKVVWDIYKNIKN